jgi:Carboxypeptidase regulatory-like domain/TonB dependent receptor
VELEDIFASQINLLEVCFMKSRISSAHRFSPFSLRNVIGVVSLSLAVLVGCSQLFAQGNAGRVLGAVTDQTGGAVVGATVTIVDTQRNLTRTVTTDNAGEYNVPSLLPSTYTVSAAFQGFKTAVRSGVTLEVSQDLRVDLVLQPGEQTEKVTVTEAIPLIETTNAELGGTLQAQIIDNLPLNGRNFENLLQLRPGVTIYPGGSGWAQSTNGLRPQDNVYLVNGINATDPWMSQSVFNAVMASGDAGTILPVDAIDEFKTEENPRAEYGWRPGAIVNIGIKSGTNSVHGSGYAYGRDTVFDARNYFNPNYCPSSAPCSTTKQPVALEQFGGTFGGPIKKDKLFYFVNYEGQRYSIGNPDLHSKIPTPAGLVAACQTALASPTFAPLSASLAGLTNTCAIDPSKTTTAGGVQFQGLLPVSTAKSVFTDLANNNTVNGGLAKINYHLSDKHSLEGMYFISQGEDLAVDAPATQTATNWLSIEHARSQAASGDWTWTPSSSWVNEVRVGYAHYYQLFETQDHSVNVANYSFNGNTYVLPTGITNPIYGGFPETRIAPFDGNSRIGGGWPKIIGPDGVLTILDHISYLRGKHAFKFGGEILANRSIENETSNAKGPVQFSSLTDFFSGTLHQANLFLGNPIRNLTNQGYALFFQDDWRLKPRLIVNLGLRYEINTVVKDKNGQLANFDPTSATGLVQSNSPYQGDHKDFAPRLGIAWDVRGNGKTVVRAGAGITYEQMGFDVLNGEGNLLGLRTMPTGLPRFNAGSTTSLPTSGNIDLQSLTFAPNTGALNTISNAWRAGSTLYASVKNPACGDGFTVPPGFSDPPGPCEIYGVIPNLRAPYVTQWNLDVERAITNNLSLDVVYVGNHGSRLLGKLDNNQAQLVNGFSPGWGDPSNPASPAGICKNSASDATPYDQCGFPGNVKGTGVNGAAEQAALPFTAPCAANIAGLGATNGSGGPFNPNNKCLSYLNYVTLVDNAYTSNYNGMQATLTGRNYRGFSFTAGYTYSHALGEASGQGTGGTFNPPENSYGSLRQQLYSNTDFDIRHRFTLSLNYAIPGRKGFGQTLEGWGINSIVVIQSGLPWGLADSHDDFSGTNEIGNSTQARGEQWDFFGNPNDFTPVHGFTETNGGILSGGTGGLPYFPGGGTAAAPTSNATCNAKAAAMGPLALASLFNLGCFSVGNSVLVPSAVGSYGTTPQNLFRDAGFKNWDLSVTKQFKFRERLSAEFRVEFFNVLNHPNFANPSGGPGGAVNDPSSAAGFGIVASTPDTYSSNPQLGSGGGRAMQLGLKLSF